MLFKSTTSEIIRHSLQDLSTGYDSDKEDLRVELQKLKSELESAHLEIQKIREENISLKNALSQRNKSLNLPNIFTEQKKKNNQKANKNTKIIYENLTLSFDRDIDNSYPGFNDSSNEKITNGTTGALTSYYITLCRS